MNKKSVSFKSTDGVHILKGNLYLPDSTPKGIFHHVHGMCEHKERYDSFLREICDKGYICVIYDNLGHGETANDESELGYFAKKGGYKYLAEDVFSVSKQLKRNYRDLPYILMGHSMGSFIVRLAAAEHPDICDKLIVMGTAGPNPAFKPALAMTSAIKSFRGEKHFSPFLEGLAFGAYNKRFGEDVSGDWLSKDPEVRRMFNADKFCNFHFTVSGMHDLVKINDVVNSGFFFNNVSKTMPILLISGEDDPVGNYGKGVKAVYKKLKSKGANVRMKIYKDNRHELLNDTARDEVIRDILNFI